MSYYEQVANMLGLELGEKFKLRNDESNYCDDTFYFQKMGLKTLIQFITVTEFLMRFLGENLKL